MGYSAEHREDAPGESPTDQAADAAFVAIDARLRALGFDPERAGSLVMVGVADGRPAHSTVAANLPGEVTPERMLEFAVMQLSLLAAECGVKLVIQSVSN